MPSSKRRHGGVAGVVRKIAPAPPDAGETSGRGQGSGASYLIVESCNSTWLFDTERMNFRRVLKGLSLDARHASTGWRPYRRLHLDGGSDRFLVILNDAGTRCIRSWRHADGCTHCGGDVTAELSREELSLLVGA